jgi:hypothetical protein
MSLLNQYNKNGVKNDLITELASGEISHRFEVVREYTGHTGGRNIASNTFSTIFFLPWLIGGLIFILAGFVALFGPDSEVPIFVTLCCIFPGGIIVTMIGFFSVRDSVGEVINPEEYEKYEVTVFFNRGERYLAEVKVVLDATNDELIGEITFLDEITLSNKSEIYCKFIPGSDGAVRPDFNNFFVSHGDVSIQLDGHTYLNEKKRIAIAKEWSEKLGVIIGEPLLR